MKKILLTVLLGTTILITNNSFAGSLPVITTQPINVTAKVGQTATFSVTATGATSYQWWSSTGGTFTAMAGQTAASRTTAPLLITSNGNKYYCVVSNASGSVQSSIITLSVIGAAPSFTMTFVGVPGASTCALACGTNAGCLNACTSIAGGVEFSGMGK